MSFADNLVYLRQHYGITQEGLAEQLSVCLLYTSRCV